MAGSRRVPLHEPPGSRCFVCAPGNPLGLQVRFDWDEGQECVLADVRLGDLHCGAPGFVHVGITTAILADAMAWSVVAGTGRFVITLATGCDFDRPVRPDVDYEVRAWAGPPADPSGTLYTATAELRTPDRVHARATTRFQAISPATAERLRARVSRPASGTRAPVTGPAGTAGGTDDGRPAPAPR